MAGWAPARPSTRSRTRQADRPDANAAATGDRRERVGAAWCASNCGWCRRQRRDRGRRAPTASTAQRCTRASTSASSIDDRAVPLPLSLGESRGEGDASANALPLWPPSPRPSAGGRGSSTLVTTLIRNAEVVVAWDASERQHTSTFPAATWPSTAARCHLRRPRLRRAPRTTIIDGARPDGHAGPGQHSQPPVSSEPMNKGLLDEVGSPRPLQLVAV